MGPRFPASSILRFSRVSSRSFSTSAPILRPVAPNATYVPPIPAGVLPVYDEALAIIKRDQDKKRSKIEQIKWSLEKEVTKDDVETQKRLKDQMTFLEIETEINDPEVRRRFRNGIGDMSKPVYRHLTEMKWRTEGRLAMQLQRMTQMGLVPDLIPSIDPVLDPSLHVSSGEIESGSFLEPSETLSPPILNAQVFHTDVRLYTLLLIDPDVPDTSVQGFTTYCHQLITNIPLSVTLKQVSGGSSVLPYIPPHPQNGSPYHRYTYVFFSQPSASPELAEATQAISGNGEPTDPVSLKVDISPENVTREAFNVREFMKQYELTPAAIVFFRQVWEENAVGKVYKEILLKPEPRYGRIPKPSRRR